MLKIKYNIRGDPVALKIDSDGWIYRNPYDNRLDTGQVNRLDDFFNQILRRAIRYQDFLDNHANRLDDIVKKQAD